MLLPLLYSNFEFRLVDMRLTEETMPLNVSERYASTARVYSAGHADSLPTGATRTTGIIEAMGLYAT